MNGTLQLFQAAALVKDCREAGVAVRVEGSQLKVAGQLTDDLRSRLRSHKADVLAYLGPQANYPAVAAETAAASAWDEATAFPAYDRACDALVRIWRLRDTAAMDRAVEALNAIAPETKKADGIPF